LHTHDKCLLVRIVKNLVGIGAAVSAVLSPQRAGCIAQW